MNILIFGSGAVGSLIGGFLRKAGHQVALLGRPWHMDVIGQNGLAIKGIWGTHRVRFSKLYTDVRELGKGKLDFDLIILTVKSFDTAKAVSETAPLLSKKTVLVSFQNGLGNIEIVLKKIPSEQYLIGRIITGVDITPGAVEVTVSADALAVGSVHGSKPLRSPQEIADLFTRSKIPARAVPNIPTLIWAKVIYNCALNGPSSIFEIPYGKMLGSADRIASMRKIVDECYQVGQAKGIALDPAEAEAFMKLLVNELIPRTAAHYPSMLGDLRKGRRTEIDALNGAICRLGRELNIPTPENQKITGLIHGRETPAR
ncbi:MAG: 2-dehydropantoate 2-reductase [Candidatus Omnitrophica bacterium]|nr:2-dehydropantoate 2-reductase [Candidatus Omnitrophota bacterium]